MSSWGAAPAKGRIFRCARCCDPLAFLPHRRVRLSQEEASAVGRRITVHVHASPDCRCAGARHWDAIGCQCSPPSPVWRDDGVHCARCNGQIEWATCRPAVPVWRGDGIQPVAATG